MHVSKWHFPLTLRFFFFTRGKENRSKIQILSFRFLSERQNRNIKEYSPVIFGAYLIVILVWFPFVNQPSDLKTAAVLCLSSKKLSALPSWVVIGLSCWPEGHVLGIFLVAVFLLWFINVSFASWRQHRLQTEPFVHSQWAGNYFICCGFFN